MNATTIDIASASTGRRPLARRLARLGFWFILLKGLAWLAAPLAAWHVVG
jgi:hypothetical protein